MFEEFLRRLEALRDWEMYREVATVLVGEQLVGWRRLYESRPGRDVLLREAGRILTGDTKKRFPRSFGIRMDSRPGFVRQ